MQRERFPHHHTILLYISPEEARRVSQFAPNFMGLFIVFVKTETRRFPPWENRTNEAAARPEVGEN